MLEIVIVIFGLAVFGLLTYIMVKDTYEARKLYRRKVEALEAIAEQLHEIKLDMYNFVK